MSFSLDGKNEVDALLKLVEGLLLPSIEELCDRALWTALEEIGPGGLVTAYLPGYTLQLHSRVVQTFLLEVYDRPFKSDQEFEAALTRRFAS